jgi:IS1 family transposase
VAAPCAVHQHLIILGNPISEVPVEDNWVDYQALLEVKEAAHTQQHAPGLGRIEELSGPMPRVKPQ